MFSFFLQSYKLRDVPVGKKKKTMVPLSLVQFTHLLSLHCHNIVTYNTGSVNYEIQMVYSKYLKMLISQKYK